ncbi:MAG: aldehyde dehydrogenase family protein [Candidatus Gracilibacteria bacterium]
MNSFSLFIKDAKSTGTIVEIKSPYDGALVGKVEKADSAALEKALKNAADSFENIMKTMPAWKRAEILYKVADLMKEHHEDLSQTIAQEGGKPLKDAKVEITRAINTVRMSGNEALQMNGEQLTMDRAAGTENHLAFTIREPIGPVLAISAFNHPVNLICHQVATAFAAGNSVIVKPASQTPLSCLKLAKLFQEAGLPDGVLNVAIVGGADTEQLVKDSRIRFITFIGSGKVGWEIEKTKHEGTRLSLEHGGTACAIVDSSADIEKILPGLVRGSFYHAGQVCVSTQNIYVHESKYEEVLSKMVEKAKLLKVGAATDEDTDIGPIISKKEQERILSWIQEAKAQGARIELGGNAVGDSCIDATILTSTSMKMKVMNAEVFGPVVNIIPFSDIEAVIKEINATPFSFQAAVYAQDINTALNTAKKIDAKACIINDPSTFRVDWMPFGGAKESGLGVGGVRSSMHEMSQEKLIIVKL